MRNTGAFAIGRQAVFGPTVEHRILALARNDIHACINNLFEVRSIEVGDTDVANLTAPLEFGQVKRGLHIAGHVESYTSDGSALGSSKDSYAQGDTVTVTLKPGETQIWNLSQKGDTQAPKLDTMYVKGAKSLRVQASEHVTGAKFTVTVDGKQVECKSVEASADMRTFDIKLVDVVKSGSKIEVTAAQGQDASGNGLEGSVSGVYRQNGIIASAETSTGGELSNAKDSVEGKNGFTVATSVSDAASSTVLLSQGEEWKLGIDKDGKAYFVVNGTTATSDVTVTGGNVTITGVRENNGMLKIYVDGELAGSAYLGAKNADHVVSVDAITAGNGTKQTSLAVYDHALA